MDGNVGRALAFLVGFLLVAPEARARQAAARIRVVLPAYSTPIAIDTIMQGRRRLDAPAGQVWTSAERVFYDLKVTTDVRDSVAGYVGVKNLVKSSSMAGKPMSAWLNCGIDMTGPKADIYRLNIALIAIVTPLSATQTELGVGLAASGLDMRGSSANPVICATTGRLEVDFVERAARILAMP
jgi:hypothetical protein